MAKAGSDFESPTGARSIWRRCWVDWVRPLGTTALVVFAFRSAIADWNDVPTGSMQPTIFEGERIFVNRLAYDLKVPFTTWRLAEWSEPKRGDIVVFYSPADGTRLVKRVIGLPGDSLSMKDNRLVLDGVEIDYTPMSAELSGTLPISNEMRARRELAFEELPGRRHPVMGMRDRPARREFEARRIPEGQYFVMGDSRDNSFDSRFFGPVPRASILGRATAIVASLDPDDAYTPRWGRWLTALP